MSGESVFSVAFLRGYSRTVQRGIHMLVYDPEEFFSGWVDDYGARDEFLFLGVMTLVVFLTYALGIYQVGQQYTVLPALGEAFVEDAITTSVYKNLFVVAFARALEPFFLWGFYTVVLYFSTWIYSDRGTVFLLGKYVSWALFPLLVYYVLRFIAWFVTLFLLWDEFVKEGRFADPRAEAAYYFGQVLGEPLVLLVSVLLIPLIVWMAVLVANATAEVRRIPRSTALKVAVIPAGLHALYVIRQIALRVELL